MSTDNKTYTLSNGEKVTLSREQRKATEVIFGEEFLQFLDEKDAKRTQQPQQQSGFTFENGRLVYKTGEKVNKPASMATHLYGQPQQQPGFQATMGNYLKTVGRR